MQHGDRSVPVGGPGRSGVKGVACGSRRMLTYGRSQSRQASPWAASKEACPGTSAENVSADRRRVHPFGCGWPAAHVSEPRAGSESEIGSPSKTWTARQHAEYRGTRSLAGPPPGPVLEGATSTFSLPEQGKRTRHGGPPGGGTGHPDGLGLVRMAPSGTRPNLGTAVDEAASAASAAPPASRRWPCDASQDRGRDRFTSFACLSTQGDPGSRPADHLLADVEHWTPETPRALVCASTFSRAAWPYRLCSAAFPVATRRAPVGSRAGRPAQPSPLTRAGRFPSVCGGRGFRTWRAHATLCSKGGQPQRFPEPSGPTVAAAQPPTSRLAPFWGAARAAPPQRPPSRGRGSPWQKSGRRRRLIDAEGGRPRRNTS